jgi:hypothetical protein
MPAQARTTGGVFSAFAAALGFDGLMLGSQGHVWTANPVRPIDRSPCVKRNEAASSDTGRSLEPMVRMQNCNPVRSLVSDQGMAGRAYREILRASAVDPGGMEGASEPIVAVRAAVLGTARWRT